MAYSSTDLKLNPNTTARSLKVLNIIAQEQAAGLSFRSESELLQLTNALNIAPGTIHDIIARYGSYMRNKIELERKEIFKQYDYYQNGLPKNVEKTKQELGIKELSAHPTMTELAKSVGAYNTVLEVNWNKLPKNNRPLIPNRVNSIAFQSTIERQSPDLPLVYISVDEVMVKKQKETRDISEPHYKRSNRKRKLTPHAKGVEKKLAKKKYQAECQERLEFSKHCKLSFLEDKRCVSTTTVTIKWDNNFEALIAPSLDEGFINLIAFLLRNKLMDRHLVFLIDGAQCLKKNIDKFFNYCNYQIIMDWYHVAHQLDSMIGRGTSGTIEERKAFRKQIKSDIWYYNYAQAFKDIASLKQEHSSKERCSILTNAETYLKNKLPMLTCYGFRKYLGLPNSSNSVERYNGLIVSSRQKHQGISWSQLGSNNQALIGCAKYNHKLDCLLQGAVNEDYDTDLAFSHLKQLTLLSIQSLVTYG